MSDERERNPLDGPANGPSSSGQTPDDPGTGEPEPVELLSAYLDDDPDLDPALRNDLEARLEDDAELRQIYAEMDVIRQGLRDLPGAPAPRSYHVTPRMLGIPEPVPLHQREPWYERHAGGLRLATSVAAVLFVFVLAADLTVNTLTGPGPGGDSDDADDTQSVTELRTADDDDDNAAAEPGDGEVAGGEAEADLAPADVELTPTVAIADDSAGSEPPAEGDEDAPVDEEAVEEEVEEESAGADTDQATAAITLEEADATTADEAAQDGAGTAVEEPQVDDADAEESAPQTEAHLFAEEPDAAGDTAARDENGDGGLRMWRIAEFGLVAVLGVLLTATVVLPRLGARGRGGR